MVQCPLDRLENTVEHLANPAIQRFGFKTENRSLLTFQVVQCISQHFEHTDIDRVTEGFVVEVDSSIGLKNNQRKCVRNMISN